MSEHVDPSSEQTPSPPVRAQLLAHIQQLIHDTLEVAQTAMGAEQEYNLTIQSLHERINRDDLTGLYNKTFLVSSLEQRIAQNKPFGVFALDLNGFKTVNDTFGHQTGDTLLQAWALFFKSHFKRREDVISFVEREPTGDEASVVARTGGDEFIGVVSAVAPEPREEERRPTSPTEYMEREMVFLRTSAQNFITRIPHIPRLEMLGSTPLGVSVGYSLWSPEEPLSTTDLLRQADQAMYADKQTRGGSR